jgi:hypothetical protein
MEQKELSQLNTILTQLTLRLSALEAVLIKSGVVKQEDLILELELAAKNLSDAIDKASKANEVSNS